jgi:hypothetical protein
VEPHPAILNEPPSGIGRIRRARILMALLTLLVTLPGVLRAASAGKYAGEFMSIGVGGRALALGSAFVGLADDVTAGYWNPAGLSRLSYPQLGLMHDERFAGLVNYDYGAVAMPLGPRSTLALSVIRLGVDDIPDTRNAGVDAAGNPLPPDEWENFAGLDQSRIVYFNSADWAIYVSYSRRISEVFSYGANIKFIRRDNGDASATGIGFDVGALAVFDRLTLGVNVQDVTSTLVAWNTGRNELIIPTLKLGGTYAADLFGQRLSPVADVDVRFEGRGGSANLNAGPVSFDFHGGLEFAYNEVAALRVGYTDIGSVTMGAGVKLPKINLDYSFSKFDSEEQLGNTHRVSIMFTLEAERFLRPGS